MVNKLRLLWYTKCHSCFLFSNCTQKRTKNFKKHATFWHSHYLYSVNHFLNRKEGSTMNKNIRKALLKAVQEGMQYEDMTPSMQKEYDKVSLLADFMIAPIVEYQRQAEYVHKMCDMLDKLGDDENLSKLTEEEELMRQQLVEFLNKEEKKPAVFSQEKQKIVKAAKMRAKTLAEDLNGKYLERESFGSLTIEVYAVLFEIAGDAVHDFRFLVNNADEMEFYNRIESQEEDDCYISAAFTFKSNA